MKWLELLTVAGATLSSGPAQAPGEVAMTLRDELDAERERRFAVPGVREAFTETLAQLGHVGAGGTAPRPGDAFPDFLLPDTEGRLVARDRFFSRSRGRDGLVACDLRCLSWPGARRFRRRVRRLPFQVKGVGRLFQAWAVCSNQPPISAGLRGCWPSSARRFRMRWMDSAMFSQLPPSGV